MAGEGKLIIRNAAGAKVAELVGDATGAERGGYWSVACQRRVNEVGELVWTMHGDSPAIGYLEDKGQIEYHRRDPERGIPWYREFLGFYRDEVRDRSPVFTGIALSTLHALEWRHVLYKTGVTNRSSFASQAAETILKRLATYNLTSSGSTADGRLRAATSAGLVNGLTIAVEADAAGGALIAGFDCAQQNLLKAMQKLALIAGGDFDLVKTGATSFELRFYAGQLGTDRTAEVSFSTTFDNMARPRYRVQRSSEKTVAVIGGKGQEALRLFVTATGTNYAADNDIETFLSYTNSDSINTLTAFGESQLARSRARAIVDFKVVQAGRFYARDYFLGDLVRSRYAGIETDHKVQGVTIVEERGAESIDVELVTL